MKRAVPAAPALNSRATLLSSSGTLVPSITFITTFPLFKVLSNNIDQSEKEKLNYICLQLFVLNLMQ